MPQMKTEKRIYRRFNFDADVGLETRDYRRRFVRAYLDDISLSGLRLRAQEEIPVGKKVNFAFTTPLLKDSVWGKGRVRHVTLVKRYGGDVFYMGVEFERVKRNRIKKLIEGAYKIREKVFLPQQHKRELSFVVKILPFLILAGWLIAGTADKINDSMAKNSIFAQKIEDGIIYYLSHR